MLTSFQNGGHFKHKKTICLERLVILWNSNQPGSHWGCVPPIGVPSGYTEALVSATSIIYYRVSSFELPKCYRKTVHFLLEVLVLNWRSFGNLFLHYLKWNCKKPTSFLKRICNWNKASGMDILSKLVLYVHTINVERNLLKYNFVIYVFPKVVNKMNFGMFKPNKRRFNLNAS